MIQNYKLLISGNNNQVHDYFVLKCNINVKYLPAPLQ